MLICSARSIRARTAPATATKAHIENIINFCTADDSASSTDGVADQVRAHLNIAVQPMMGDYVVGYGPPHTSLL